MVKVELSHDIADDDVVISGFSGRFPMSDNIDELRENLFSKESLVEPFDDPLWKNSKLHVPNQVGQISKKNKFDAGFFGIHHKHSSSLDLLTRLILEKAFEALVDAGLNPSNMAKTNTMVVTAASISESENSWLYADVHSGLEFLGHARTMLANRVSYWLNMNASSFAITSMETAGTEALSLAYSGIKAGHYDAAIVGSISVVMLPEISYHYNEMGLLAEDGKTMSFDANAHGYARSDGVGVMILQRAKDAKRVYAKVVHSYAEINGDKKAPMIKPMKDHMARMLEEFYQNCGVDPSQVSFLEADGSALKDWDEAELNAVSEVLLRKRKSPLLIGSVKSNLGHANAASNFAAIAKVLIAMQTGKIPPNINYEKPLPTVPALVENKLKVVTEATPWNGGLAAINAIGLCGVYGHTVLQSFERKTAKQQHEGLPRLIVLSGRTQDTLEETMFKLESMPLDVEFIGLMHEVYSTNINNHLHRGYTILPTGETTFHEVQYLDANKRPIWFIFSGMGSQWPGMGLELLKLPACAATLHKCHEILAKKGLDLMHIITTNDATIFDNILHSFVGIAAIQLALVDLLTLLGIKPDGMIGHSVGEIGCAYADGCMDLEQTLLSAYYRGMASVEAELIQGYMAAVGLGYEQLKNRVPPEVDIACHNSETSATISGPVEPVKKFVEELKSEGVFARVVNVANIAYHSRYIKPAAPALLNSLRKLIVKPKPRSSRWVCTSVPKERWNTHEAQYCSAEYLTNNLLSSVLFEEGSKYIPDNAIAIEIAPHGLLQAILRRSLPSDCTNIPLTHRGHQQGLHFLLAAIGKIYMNGAVPQVSKLYPPVQFPVSKGTPSLASFVAWDHSNNWHVLDDIHITDTKSGETDEIVSLNNAEDRVYAGHVIDGRIRYPTFAYLKLVWQTLSVLQENECNNMPVVFENVRIYHTIDIPERGTLRLYVMVQRGSGQFEVCQGRTLLATGRVVEPENITKEFVKDLTVPDENEGVSLEGEELYHELEHRGYNYRGQFRSLVNAKLSQQGAVANVQWSGNWVIMGEAILQLVMLQKAEHDQSLQVPSAIQRIVINPLEFPTKAKDLEAVYHRATEVARCGGIEVNQVRTVPLESSALSEAKYRLDTVKFVRHTNPKLDKVEQFIDMCVQIVVENCSQSASDNINVVELTSSQNSQSLSLYLKSIETKFPQVSLKSVPVGSSKQVIAEQKSGCCLVVVTRSSNVKEAQSLLQRGFILVNCDDRDLLSADPSLLTVAQYSAGSSKFVLLRNAYQPDPQKTKVLNLSGDASSWVDQVKKAGSSERLYVVAEVKSQGVGVLPLFTKKIVADPALAHVRCVFLCDKNTPAFSLSKEPYQQQLRKDLITNVLLEAVWGGFHSVSLDLNHESQDKCLDSQVLSVYSIEDVNVQFLGLNSKNMDISSTADEEDKQLGLLEYSGRSSSGKRLMGIARKSEDKLSICKYDHLTWEVPNNWNMEEAATVPLAYSIAYYSLVLIGKLKSGESVLIQAGWSSIGQAAIALALDIGCTVYTTVTTQEQKLFIKKRYPKVLDRHIFSLKNLVMEVLTKTSGKGVSVILNTVSGGNINNSVRCMAANGRFIQLARNDLSKNKVLGMEIFLKNTAFFGVASENLFNMTPDWKKTLHSGVQEKIQSSVIQPLVSTVYTKQQTPQALKALFDVHHVGKVLLSVSADDTSVILSQKYKCDTNSSYLVSGGNAEQCVDVVEWLVIHGARQVVIALSSKTASNHVTRRVSLLQSYHNAEVVLVCTPPATSATNAANLLKAATAKLGGKLNAIFILPAEESGQENGVTASIVSHLDTASRNISSLQHFVCLLSESSWETCEARRMAGLPALAVHWPDCHRKGFILRSSLQILDNILTSNPIDPIVLVNEERRKDDEKVLSTSELDTFLPASLHEVSALGEDVDVCSSCCLQELISLSPGYELARETPPVFIVPGLQGTSEDFLHPLVGHIMFPVFSIKLPSKIKSIPDVATELVKQVVEIQKTGPVNLVGLSWGGALTLELAKQLEALGRETRVMLLDGALETTLNVTELLKDGVNMQVNLISRLLQINPKVNEELVQLPDWSSRLDRALLEVPREMEQSKSFLKTAVTTIYDRILAVQNYRNPNILLNGEVILVRPSGGFEDNCGLTQFFKKTVNIHMVDGNHRTILSNNKTAYIINNFVW